MYGDRQTVQTTCNFRKKLLIRLTNIEKGISIEMPFLFFQKSDFTFYRREIDFQQIPVQQLDVGIIAQF